MIHEVIKLIRHQSLTHTGSRARSEDVYKRQRLSFPLDLTVKGVEFVNPPADTLLSLQSLTVRVRALPLLRKQVLVEAIDLRNVKVNTGTMIEGMEIKGFLGKLYLHADRIDLSEENATFNTVDLSDTDIRCV